jgi:hypothetical protein
MAEQGLDQIAATNDEDVSAGVAFQLGDRQGAQTGQCMEIKRLSPASAEPSAAHRV